jgi:hypothetical protein
LSLVKSFQRHQIRGPRSENRVQRNLQATLNVKHPTPNADRRTKEDRDQRSEKIWRAMFFAPVRFVRRSLCLNRQR